MRGRRQFSGTDSVKIANSQISVFVKKVAKLEYFANFFRRVLLFDVFYHHYHVRREIVLRFVVIFAIVANIASFLDHRKENADVSKSDGQF